MLAKKTGPFSENVKMENGDGRAFDICKVKFILEQATKSQNGRRYIVLLFL